MSPFTRLASGPAPQHARPRAGFIASIVVAASAAAAVSSLVTAAWMGAAPAAAEPHRRIAAAPAPAVANLSLDTGVPDASQVFAGREHPVEEPAPTF